MPQNYAPLIETKFVKGLVTELNDLNFPENATTAESNCDLKRTGTRRRRLGILPEDGSQLSEIVSPQGGLVRTLTWYNVGDQPGLEFTVVQVGEKLVFYDKSVVPTSAQTVPVSNTNSDVYTVSLADYLQPNSDGAGTSPVEVTSIDGALIVASSEIDTFVIERDRATESFTETRIKFRERDFEYLSDKTQFFKATADLTPGVARIYDTLNCGWYNGDPNETPFLGTGGPLATWTAARSTYPPLTLPWHSAKNASGTFSVTLFEALFAGTTVSVNGHFIIDPFAMDRQTQSGIPESDGVLPVREESGRFTSVSTFAGRVFYTGLNSKENASKVYFSPVLDSLEKLGDCFQINDPTSEVISDLLDTDGGVVQIKEAQNIIKMHPMGAALLVFADNGVWAISGVDGIFRATDFSITKISEIGIATRESFISADGRPYWWGHTGIYTMEPTQIGGVQTVDLSRPTIQSFWEDISGTSKEQVIAEFDSINKRVMWLYPTKGSATDFKYNELLIFDEVLEAFFPWTVGDQTSSTNYIVGSSFFKGAGTQFVEATVVDSNGNTVVDSNGDTVITRTKREVFTDDVGVKFVYRDGATGKLSFADFSGTRFLDWGEVDYSSFAETNHKFSRDTILKKCSPYLKCFFEITEEGYEANADATGFDILRPSGCLVSAFWDGKTSPSSTPQQAYRLRNVPVPDEADLTAFPYPYTFLSTRLKVRGRGSSVKLRFESETGKDFALQGFELLVAENDRL